MAGYDPTHPGLSDEKGVPESLPDTFGNMLRRYRLARGLNQLALGSRALLDNTMISRFETGKQLPSMADFERLSVVLKLSTSEKEKLTFVLQQAILQKKSIPSELYLQPDEVVALASERVESVRLLRLDGKGQLAATQAVRDAYWIRTFIGRTKSDSIREVLLRSLAFLLVEESKSYQDYVLPSEVSSHIMPLIEEQLKVASLLNDPKLALLADLTSEGAYFIQRHIGDAQKICLRLITRKDWLSSEWQREVLRAAAINIGFLEDKEGIVWISKSIEHLLEHTNRLDTMDDIFLLEGLARGQGLLRSTNAFKTLERIWSLMDQGNHQGKHMGLRTVQVIRTQLKVMQSLREINAVEIERLGTRGILLCDELGYLRQREEISDLLESILNSK